jgi:uncharacterized protein YcaQ
LIEYLKENAAFRRYVLRELEQRGPLLSREIEDHKPSRREAHRWWGSRQVAMMLEILHGRGVTVLPDIYVNMQMDKVWLDA